MESRAKLLGHSIHQMLIPFPLGLLTTAAIFDVIYLVTDNTQWVEVSFYLIIAGIIGGLLAAVFGLIDFLGIPGNTRARRIGLLHGAGNVTLVALFAASVWLRLLDPLEPPGLAIGLALLGAALGTVTGWLGGELVDRLGVGVDDGAHLDAPSSLSKQSARTRSATGD
jgi:uncharacterized membrane protein